MKSKITLALIILFSVVKAQVFTSSNLPIVVLKTFGGVGIPDEPKVPCVMGIIDNPTGRNNVTDPYTGYFGKILIEQRGALSQVYSQKSWLLETVDAATDASIKVPLLGMPAEDEWILYAPYNDKSMIRNYLIYRLMSEMGHWAPRMRFCEVTLNGQYVGVYALMENIKRGKNRVNIDKMDIDDNAGDSLTGGYIVEYGFPPKYPKNPTPQQQNYIYQYFNDFSTALYGANFADPSQGYNKYIKVSTFIDYLLIVDFGRNQDSYARSTYFYKENISNDSGQLKAGPVWDYNYAFGTSPWYGAVDQGFIYYLGGIGNTTLFMNRLMEDSNFANKTSCRYDWLWTKTFDTVYVNSIMDVMHDSLKEASQRQFTLYPQLLNPSCFDCYNNYSPLPVPVTFEEEYRYVKDWLHRRITWIDANLPGNCHSVGTEENTAKEAYLVLYPNPVQQTLNINFLLNQANTISYEIYNANGQLVLKKELGFLQASDYTIPVTDFENVNAGLYLLKLNTGSQIINKTFIKQ